MAKKNELQKLGLDEKTVTVLSDAGVTNLEELAKVEDLTDIKGIGSKTAKKIQKLVEKASQKEVRAEAEKPSVEKVVSKPRKVESLNQSGISSQRNDYLARLNSKK